MTATPDTHFPTNPPPAGIVVSDACSGLSVSQLRARAIIAGDLYREGRILRCECFRLEMDAYLGRDSGPIQYEENTEFKDLLTLAAHYSPNSK